MAPQAWLQARGNPRRADRGWLSPRDNRPPLRRPARSWRQDGHLQLAPSNVVVYGRRAYGARAALQVPRRDLDRVDAPPPRTVAASKNDARQAPRKQRGRSKSAPPRGRWRRFRAPRLSALSSRSVTTSSRLATRCESVVWAGPGPGVQPSAAPRDGRRLWVAFYSPVSPRCPWNRGFGIALL